MPKKKNKTTEKFTCHFSDGSTVSITIDLDNLNRILDRHVTSANSPSIKKHLLPEYIAWMHTVMSTLAKRLGRTVPYAYPSADSDEPVFFLYKPDGSYEEIPEG